MTGPIEDDYNVCFHWRVHDIINAMIDSELRVLHTLEFSGEKNYVRPFWISEDEYANGVTATKEEVDRMYDWHYNPAIALPIYLSIVASKIPD